MLCRIKPDRSLSGLEDLSGLLEVAALLHTLSLHGAGLQLLQEAVGSTGAQQHVGPRSVGEHWTQTGDMNLVAQTISLHCHADCWEELFAAVHCG